MNPRALRLVRGSVVTATSVAVASTAHFVAGGHAPGLAGLLTALVVGTVLGTALLSGERLTALRTAAAIVGGQYIFHSVFSWGSVTVPGVTPAADSHGHAAVAMPSTVSSLPDALAEHGASNMLVAHVVAGLVSLAVLLAEQRLLDRVVALARRVVARLLTFGSPAGAVTSLPRLSAVSAPSGPRVAFARTPSCPRGPPAVALAA